MNAARPASSSWSPSWPRVGGYRLGFLARVASWIGLAVGARRGRARILPWVTRPDVGPVGSLHLVVASLVLLGGAVDRPGHRSGRGRPAAPGPPARARLRDVDRAVGAASGRSGSSWRCGCSCRRWRPCPAGRPGQTADSAIARWVSPGPPDAARQRRRCCGAWSAQAPPRCSPTCDPAPTGGPPAGRQLAAAAVTGRCRASTVKVEGQACDAHPRGERLRRRRRPGRHQRPRGGRRAPGQTVGAAAVRAVALPATVVMFDPRRDLALL